MAIVKHTPSPDGPLSYEDAGAYFFYGSEVAIDSSAVEIRGGDLDEDEVISVCFGEEDLPAVALDILDSFADEDIMRRVQKKAEAILKVMGNPDEEELEAFVVDAWLALYSYKVFKGLLNNADKAEEVAAA